jgi:hypothetical protein
MNMGKRKFLNSSVANTAQIQPLKVIFMYYCLSKVIIIMAGHAVA